MTVPFQTHAVSNPDNKFETKPIMTISAEQIVSRYLELRAFKKAESDAFSEKMRPYNDAMEALERAAMELMQATGQKALSAKSGTAYQSHTISLTCENPTEFLDWVFQHQARQFLTAHVNKDAVKEFMDGPGEGHPPPGVKVQPVININFRKA